MTKITVSTTAGKKTSIISEKTTFRQVLEDNGINYNTAQNFLNSKIVPAADLDKTLEELGAGSECRVSSVVKMDNAAKITVNGSAAILTSGVKLADWARIAETFPEAMIMVDEDTDEPVFAVALEDNSCGSLQDVGATFGSATDKDGYATITMLMDIGEEDPIESLSKACGNALLKLNDMEKAVPDILQEVEKREKEIKDCITRQ